MTMLKGNAFLAFRMAVYVFAVPVAAYLGGSFDPLTGILTIDLNHALDLLWGVLAAAAAFGAGRVAKVKGGAT